MHFPKKIDNTKKTAKNGNAEERSAYYSSYIKNTPPDNQTNTVCQPGGVHDVQAAAEKAIPDRSSVETSFWGTLVSYKNYP